MGANRRAGVAVILAIGFVTLALMSAGPAKSATFGMVVTHPALNLHAPSTALARVHTSPELTVRSLTAATAPSSTFPRTVLVETFTGVWCPHCPAETDAFWNIDHTASKSNVVVAELHVCEFAPGTGPCGDIYVPPDNTSDKRTVFYGTCGGVPNVVFDGVSSSSPAHWCGASNNVTQMQNIYDSAISNASAVPASVSIAQWAIVSNSTVVDRVNISSNVTGSYNVVSYLLEDIGKRVVAGGGGPHGVANVVRETIHNGPVGFIAGQTTHLTVRGPIIPGWNTLNFSVVSFVQNNSSKAVQNSNFAPVSTLYTTLGSDKTSINSSAGANITVRVTNTSSGGPITGASVSLSLAGGGTLQPLNGVTTSSGLFTAAYTAPWVTASSTSVVTATVSAASYTSGGAMATIVVNPLIPPTVAQNLVIAPATSQISLSWTAPASGAGGITYIVNQSAAPGGPFTLLGTTTATHYAWTGPVAGQTYWFQVTAKGSGGYSPSTPAVTATSLSAVPHGLPLSTGWWISSGALNVSSPYANTLVLYLPAGSFNYGYGPRSYAFLASQSFPTPVSVGQTPVTLDLAFQPRLAELSGTVNVGTATVTFNGTPLAVSGGQFQWAGPAGIYTLHATATGYTDNTSTVTLTPGNTSTVSLLMQPVGGTQPVGGASSAGTPDIAYIAIAGAVAAAVVLVALVYRFGPGRRGPPGRSGSARSRPTREPDEDDA